MIAITQKEKEAICEKYPNTHFVRTMKQDSKRHHYYMVESPNQMRVLYGMRGMEWRDPRSRNRNNKRGGRQ